MARRRTALLSPVLTPSISPWLFVAGIILFAVLGNAVYALVENWLQTPLAILLFSVVVLGLLLLLFQAVRRYLRPTLDANLNTHPRRGLVVLVSQGTFEGSAALAAIRYHYRGEKDERPSPTLRHCWLITSPPEPVQTSAKSPQPGFQTAWENANALKAMFVGRIDMHLVVVDHNNAEDVYEKVTMCLRATERLGLPRSEVTADYTGGTKPMSGGMVLAAATMGFSLEYMDARQHDAQGRAVASGGSDPVTLDLQYVIGRESE
jgi:hypothetical protein